MNRVIDDFKSRISGYDKDYRFSQEEVLNILERYEIKYKIKDKQATDIQLKNKLTNKEWIDFLNEQFDVSRTSAKEMLHAMMSIKRRDNFKKELEQSGRCKVNI